MKINKELLTIVDINQKYKNKIVNTDEYHALDTHPFIHSTKALTTMSKQLLFISLLLYSYTNAQSYQNPLFNLDANALRIINGAGVIAAAGNAWNIYATTKENNAAVAALAFSLLAAPHIATIIWPEPQSSIQNHHSTNTDTKNNNHSFIHIGDYVKNGSITNNNITTYYVGSCVLLTYCGLNILRENNAILNISNCIQISVLSMNLVHYFLNSIHVYLKK